MCDKQVNICIEAVMVYVQVMPQHLCRMIEANHKKQAEQGQLVILTRSELGMSYM
jgi:hypothetical protein